MVGRARTVLVAFAIGGVLLLRAGGSSALKAGGAEGPFLQRDSDVFEKSISELRDALERRQVTSRALVAAYLDRIAAYDQQGPRINAFISLNPRALEVAASLDAERAAGKSRGPLHGIPVVVKDNFDTIDMPTSGATIGLATFTPARDAFQVARLRRAGAIIIGKTNLQELAAGIVTVSSLGGQTRNPYDPARNPGGSSGGTGAAVAASFGAAGLGSDTCGSIRIPASHNNLVGLRPTYGLSSRSGVIPLSHTQDVAGPLARTIKDLALLLDATVGVDPADPTTNAAQGRIPASYVKTVEGGTIKLSGARIGVLEPLFGDTPQDAEVGDVVRRAVERMKTAGAVPVAMAFPGLADLLRGTSVIDMEFKFDLADYLAARPAAPIRTLGEILERGLYHENLEGSFRRRNAVEARDSETYRTALARRDGVRKAVLAAMDEHKVVALVYPTIRTKPALVGQSQGGSNCQLSPSTGLPALAVPAGFTNDGLPVGMELLGRAFDEPTLLGLGYAFEQAANMRRPPPSTPALTNAVARPVPNNPGSAVSPTTTLRAAFDWDPATNILSYRVGFEGAAPQDVIIGTVHRAAEPGGNGPVIGWVLRRAESSASGQLTLGAPDRDALKAGRLYVQAFTRQQPLGAARSPIVVK